MAIPTNEEFIAYNEAIIDEFRANKGVVTVPDFPILLLTTVGARSGKKHTVPLGYGLDGDQVFIVASKAGAPTNPDWFHNLRANPAVTVEFGGSVIEATAVVTDGAERDRLYKIVTGDAPALNAYELNTARVFPVVVLEGVTADS
jgi:deazaflavin-dependent oxidoreductase (nitroreductase family)